MLPPGASQRVRIAPPMGEHDRPLIFGRTGAFDIETVDAETVILTNRENAWASFMLFIVPSFIAGAAVFPWQQLLQRIKEPGGLAKAGMAILHRLQQQYLNPHDPESRTRDPESRTRDPESRPDQTHDREPEDP